MGEPGPGKIDGQDPDAPTVAAARTPQGASVMTRVKREVRELGGLAGPIILGFAGNQLLSLVDTAMVGRLGPADLAGTAVGAGMYFAVTCFGLGAMLGVEPLITQAVGAGEGARAEAVRKQALGLAVWLTLPLTLVVLILPTILRVARVEEPIISAAERYLWGRVPSILPFLLFSVLRSHLTALKITTPIVYASIWANVINLFFNALLIFGDGALTWMHLPAVGLPALGVLGSGIASTLAQVVMWAVLARAVARLAAPEGGGDIRVGHSDILKIGVPIGLTLMAEVGAFAIAGVLAARIGARAAAGHQIAITLASMPFVVTLGLGSATTVRVGHAVGRRDTAQARLTGLVGFGAACVFMGVSAIGFTLFPGLLAGILSDKPEVLAAAIPLIQIAAFFQISDGAQAVGAGALRGIGDTRFIQYANIIGHYAVGLPLAAVLAFGAGMAERGIWWGLSLGLTTVALALFFRFFRLSQREIARV